MELLFPEIHPKEWGEERWIINGSYCGKLLVLRKGFRCSLHYHKLKDEAFYVVSGRVLMEADGKSAIMIGGEAIRIPPGCRHRFSGLEDSHILECSTEHLESDSYRLEPSGSMPEDQISV